MWQRSLAARSMLLVGVLLIVTATVLAGSAATDARLQAQRSIDHALEQDADRIAVELELSEPGDINDAIRGVALDYGFLSTSGGAVIAGLSPSVAPPIPPSAVLARDAGSFAIIESARMAHGVRAIHLQDGSVALLRLGRSLEPAGAAARDALVNALLLTCALLVAALPIVAFAIDCEVAPLRALTRAVTMPGAAKEEVERASRRDDEIGALARAHLAMTQSLSRNADEVHRLTFDDPLTRLPNRDHLIGHLSQGLQVGLPMTLLIVEVSGMDRVAAGLGQGGGDQAAIGVADRLRYASAAWTRRFEFSEPVLLARIAETRFAFVAPGGDRDMARTLAEGAVAAFHTPISAADHQIAMSLTIGAAIAPEDGDDANALITSATAAASAAQTAGPHSIRFAGAALVQLAYGRIKLEQELRQAIERHELLLHFQPQVALGGGIVSGAEALARWRHPTRGFISPAEFIPVAEESGLIEDLGRYVLSEASRVSASWARMGIDLRIAVNVSSHQFRNPRFAETTLDIIRTAGADAARIELEITESAAMSDPEHALRELTPLKDAGVRIAIDDFGTGYSNLATLTQLPFDVLKIDRGFVIDALQKRGARVVIGTIIGMAENLGFETVAEGVETAEHLALLTSQGCTHAQGYFFGRPMPAAAFEAWYANRLVEELRTIGVKVAAQAGVAPDSAWVRGATSSA